MGVDTTTHIKGGGIAIGIDMEWIYYQGGVGVSVRRESNINSRISLIVIQLNQDNYTLNYTADRLAVNYHNDYKLYLLQFSYKASPV